MCGGVLFIIVELAIIDEISCLIIFLIIFAYGVRAVATRSDNAHP